MLSTYRSVLSVFGVPRLFASALLGRLPQGMSSLAILLLVRAATHSYAAAGIAVGAYALASAALSPVQGRLIDGQGRARVLLPVAIAQAAVLTLLVVVAHWGASAAVLVLLSGLAGALMPSIAPTVRALLREVIEEPATRESAYALESVSQEIIWIVGPFLVALLVAVTTPSVALLLLGAICIIGTFLFVRSPLAVGRPATHEHSERTSALSSRALRMLLAPIALMGFALGAIEVGLPSLALHAGSRSASGLLLAVWSLGSMLGGLWFGSRSWRSSLPTRYRALFMAAIVFTSPLILARSIPEGVFGALLAGLTIAPLFSTQYSMVSRAVTPGTETEAFTWVTAALVTGIAGGSAAAGGVISTGGVGAPFVLGCAATLVAAVLALASKRHVIALA
jgi:MFS family permease